MCAGRLSRSCDPCRPPPQGAPKCSYPLAARTKRLAALLNPAQPFLVALRQRNLRRLFAGLVVSQAGDWLYNLALLAFVYERTGSSAWVGITTAARILPEVVLGPIGGVLADRHDRRVVMIVSDVLRAAAMAALAVVALAGGPVVLAPVLAALCTAAGAAYPQCVAAVMPRLVDEDDLPAANAARVGITSLCVIAGPLIGAALLLLGSAAITFAVNGASFLVGAMVVAALPREATRRPAAAGPSRTPRCAADLAAGWRALREHPDTLPLVGADFVSSTIYGALTVLFVLLGQKLGLGAAGYGYLLSALGVGGVLAANLANRAAASDRPASRADRRRRRGRAAAGPARPDRVDRRRARPRRRHRRRDADDRGRRAKPRFSAQSRRGLRPRLRARRARLRRRDRRRRAAGAAAASRCSASTSRCSSPAPRCWPTALVAFVRPTLSKPILAHPEVVSWQACQHSPDRCTSARHWIIASAPLALVTGNLGGSPTGGVTPWACPRANPTAPAATAYRHEGTPERGPDDSCARRSADLRATS